MSNDTKSPESEKAEPQTITPQTSELAKSNELDAEQLDKVAGGVGLVHITGGGGPGG